MEPQKNQQIDEVDLFGNELLPLRDRRGRKSFKKDKQNQDFVAVRAASGWTHKMISEAIGCDEKTLRKYFSRELQQGQLIIEGLCLDVLLRKVREGHTPSIRQLQEKINSVAPPAPKRPKADKEEGDDPDLPLGKKEQQILDAQQIPGDWGDIKARRSN